VFELLRLGRRPTAGEDRRQSHRRVTAHRGEQPAAGEVSLAVSDRDDGLSERIDAELCAFNAEMTGHQDLQPLRVAAWDHDDLLAGLCGSTWGGCGYIDLLWVRADYRRRGLGARLLEAGESEIGRRGCDQVALSTYSFQAPAFYIRAGYIESGRRSAFPHGHDQILFTKRLN
jgi:GNAT superfamily N-acetyltransferase